MKQSIKIFLIAMLAIVQAITSATYAQDVTLDLTQLGPRTENGVTVAYKWYENGANIYKSGDINNRLEISTTKNIACIKFEGKANKTGNVVVIEDNGKLSFSLRGTSVWEGKSNHVIFEAASESTDYCISQISIWYEGTPYNPGTDNEDDGDDQLIGDRMVRTPSVPQNGEPVKMAIVAARQFANLANEYGDWKTQQGYAVEEIIAEDYNSNGQLKDEVWAKSIQERLKQTRPAFVLIMGDIEQVPAFNGTVEYSQGYVTDYYYGEYEGNDHSPEAYVGRFSGSKEEHIRAQMNKTKFMSLELDPANSSWLNTSLGLHNPSNIDTYPGYNHVRDYLRDKLHVNVVESNAGATSTINNTINSGCATVTYYGHGFPNSLNGQYNVNNAADLSNANMYPIFVAMTCYTGRFDFGGPDVPCLAEQMQRMPNAGTVAYIGATRESLDQPNIYFMKGGLKNGQTYLGFMASMFPTSPKDPLNQHARTIGEGVAIGNYSINAVLPGSVALSSEYYELFGDPTYQPYAKAPLTMKVVAPAMVIAGHVIGIDAAPNSVVCISKDRKIAAVGLTDGKGHASLKIATDSKADSYTLYCSAPGYIDWQGSIAIAANDGRDDNIEDGEDSAFDFNDFTRKKVLIEKFTGQYCQNCKPDDDKLTTYLDNNKLHDKVYELRHYAYDGDPIREGGLRWPDVHNALSNAWDVSSYPIYMVDRCGQDGLKFPDNNYLIRATTISNLDRVNNRLGMDCQVSLSLDGSTYDPATRKVKIIVSGKVKEELPDLRINAFVAQNGIVAYQSQGGSDYVHNGVSRDFLTKTGVNGDALTTYSDGTFQVTFDYTVPETLGRVTTDINKMDIVVFVSSWDNYAYKRATQGQKDFSNSMVYNTDAVSITALPLKAKAPVLPASIFQEEEINLNDGSIYAAQTTTICNELTYTREFTNTDWQALYVPFALNYEEWANEFDVARINCIIDGESDQTSLMIDVLSSGSTEPNTPYLIRAKQTGEHTLVLTGKTLIPATSGNVSYQSDDYIYTFKGTYVPITDMFTKGYYALADGCLKQASSNAAQIKAQRWYLSVTPLGTASATALNIRIVDNDSTTGIDALTNPSGSVYGNTNSLAAIYDLCGRKVSRQSNSHGVIIINGKKIIR